MTETISPFSRKDRRSVGESEHRLAVGELDDHLLGAHCIAGAYRPVGRRFFGGHLMPVGILEAHHAMQFRLAAARRPYPADYPPRLLVERQQGLRLRVVNQHRHRRGIQQGLQVGLGPSFVPVPAGVGDSGGGMSGEQRDGLFVLRRELQAVFLLGEVDVAQPLAVIGDRGSQKALHRWVALGKADGPGMAGDVPQPQRPLNFVEKFQQP